MHNNPDLTSISKIMGNSRAYRPIDRMIARLNIVKANNYTVNYNDSFLDQIKHLTQQGYGSCRIDIFMQSDLTNKPDGECFIGPAATGMKPGLQSSCARVVDVRLVDEIKMPVVESELVDEILLDPLEERDMLTGERQSESAFIAYNDISGTQWYSIRKNGRDIGLCAIQIGAIDMYEKIVYMITERVNESTYGVMLGKKQGSRSWHVIGMGSSTVHYPVRRLAIGM